MSYHVFFSMSQGLSATCSVPKGLFKSIMARVLEIEKAMGIELERYPDKPGVPLRWNGFKPMGADLKDEEFCALASRHNRWIKELYEQVAFWFKNPFTIGKGHQDEGPNRAWPAGTRSEKITPKAAQKFWRALYPITIPVSRWSKDYYRERMEVIYEVMRGRTTEGITFEDKPLTIRQAAEVINLFSEFLDSADLRLDVPNGHDQLKASYDGGYTWCEKCGPVDEDDLDGKIDGCRRRKCPIKAEYADEK